MANISARTFVMLYWGGQGLAYLPGLWLGSTDSEYMLRALAGWMTLMMCGVVTLQALWIWRRLELVASPAAAANPIISRLLSRIRTLGRASFVGFLLWGIGEILLPNSAFGSVVLNLVSAAALLGLFVVGVLAANCLCKVEVDFNPDAKPSAFWTFVQFFYAGLTAGAISRRVARISLAGAILEQPVASAIA